ncbi:hypothetical protein KAR91_28265 [Candidatus Pacearchaeota archaeon]|nr:hypothetical protein [Candidatus Pacearchaeota archaeon]
MGFDKRELGKPHLDFECAKDTGKTKVWEVISTHSGDILGEIKWYWAWRRYVFFPRTETLYDVDCMRAIADFIAKEMRKRGLKK